MKYLLIHNTKHPRRKKNGKPSKRTFTMSYYFQGIVTIAGITMINNTPKAGEARRFETEEAARKMASDLGWTDITIQKAFK